jgi:flagellar basal body P-ring formation protein FlgA
MRKCLSFCMLPLLLLPPLMARGGDIQPVDSIIEAAEAHVLERFPVTEGQVQVQGGRLDPRLRLPLCDQPLDTFAATPAAAGGNTSVGVRCDGERRWSIYVPVRVSHSREVVVLIHSVARDQTLSENDVSTMFAEVGQLGAGFFTREEEVIGQRMRRSAAAGTILSPVLVDRPPMIARGDRVTLVSGHRGIAVRAPGEALSNGHLGERLRVRNLSSGKVVEGMVRGSGHVEVLAP